MRNNKIIYRNYRKAVKKNSYFSQDKNPVKISVANLSFSFTYIIESRKNQHYQTGNLHLA